MPTMKLSVEAEDVDTGTKIGDRFTRVSLTTNDYSYKTKVVVADNYGTANLWTSGTGLNNFLYAVLTTDADVWIEFTRSEPDPDERAILKLPANSFMVVPSRYVGAYASNSTRFDGSALVSDTDYGSILAIDALRDEAEGEGDANVTLMLFR